MMGMTDAFLLGIIILQSPHFTELRRRGTLDGRNPLEYCLKIHPGIPADYSDIYSLTIGETLRNFCHRKSFQFAFQIVKLHFKVMSVLNLPIFFLFRCGITSGPFKPFPQRSYLFLPTEAIHISHDFQVI